MPNRLYLFINKKLYYLIKYLFKVVMILMTYIVYYIYQRGAGERG